MIIRKIAFSFIIVLLFVGIYVFGFRNGWESALNSDNVTIWTTERFSWFIDNATLEALKEDAIEDDDALAAYKVGEYFLKFERNTMLATAWLSKAAELGNEEAAYNLRQLE